MRIKAIWTRDKIAPKSRSSFILLDDGRFLMVDPEREFMGTDKDGNRIYRDTGNPEFWNAFTEEKDWTFEKANFFIRYFGGELVFKETN